jgi:murein DD-endopeptidase MepM/ murein hydrolase activator NlpD
MKKHFLLLVLLVVFTVQGYAQITVTTRKENKDIVFDAMSNQYGSYTLVLRFAESSGLINEAIAVVKPGQNNSVYRVSRESVPRYSCRYYPGRYNAKPDANFPYLLPVKNGEKVKTSPFGNLKELRDQPTTDSILGIVFNYAGTDTVYAMRSGQIVRTADKIRDIEKPEAGVRIYDKPSRSIVEVEHQDGTIVRYVCITSGEILLKPGDRIIAGQPIAVFTQENKTQQVGIGIFYLEKKMKRKLVMPKFYTDSGVIQLEFGKEYVGASTKEIVGKELTKNEKKNLKF